MGHSGYSIVHDGNIRLNHIENFNNIRILLENLPTKEYQKLSLIKHPLQ